MAVTAKVLVENTLANVAATVVYEVPTSTTVIIDKITLANVGGTSVGVSVWLPPSAQNPVSSNAIINNRLLYYKETYTCPEVVGHVLSSGTGIAISAEVANQVAIRISGREIT